MKQEKLLLAMGDICDELILNVEDTSVKTNRRSWTKWVAVAACLCLLIATPVAATHKELLVEFLSGENRWHIGSEYRFTEKDFSKEVRDISKELGWDSSYHAMESVEETEQFLGVDLPHNGFLEAAIQDEVHVETEVDGQRIRYDTHCLTCLINGETGKLIGVVTEAAYRHGNAYVVARYHMKTDNNPYENGGGTTVMQMDGAEEEIYITSTGRECNVFYLDGNYGVDGYGYVVIDGILVEVELWFSSDVRADMTAILDGFE